MRVFAPAGHARRPVLRWAARHADRTGGRLQVLVDPDPPRSGPTPATGVLGLLRRALQDAVGRFLEPLATSAAGTLAGDLAGAVAGAGLLVVPRSLPQLPALVEVLSEPLVAVPDRPLPDRGAAVALALAPWTGPEVVGAAFDTAARYGVGLHVVAAVTAGGDADEVARACQDDLAAWRLARPEVAVDVRVVDGDPAEALLRGTRDAQLAVVGRPARGRARALFTPSPTSELLRGGTCPVLVVPPPGLPRPTWSARPGWGAAH